MRMDRHPTLTACSSGHGDKVTNGVLFRPVLTDTLTTRAFPLSDAPILTLTPRRWFAPADGTTKVYFDITLRDANGAPLPGRTVNLLSSSLGTPTSGGITDLNGKTLAYLVSSTCGRGQRQGVARSAPAACEGAMSPTAKVTFTTPLNLTDLFPNSPASYFNGDISRHAHAGDRRHHGDDSRQADQSLDGADYGRCVVRFRAGEYRSGLRPDR